MVLRVKVENLNLSEMFDKISCLGDFIICDKTIYIDTTSKTKTKKVFGNSEITEITSQNYKNNSSPMVEYWCRSKLIEQELAEYEKTDECQNRLKQISDYLDSLEKFMSGGGDSGKADEERGNKKAAD